MYKVSPFSVCTGRLLMLMLNVFWTLHWFASFLDFLSVSPVDYFNNKNNTWTLRSYVLYQLTLPLTWRKLNVASRRSSLDPEHLNMMLFLNNSLNSLFNKWENVCCERRTFTKHDILAINVYHATSTSVIIYCKGYSGYLRDFCI